MENRPDWRAAKDPELRRQAAVNNGTRMEKPKPSVNGAIKRVKNFISHR